MNNVFFLCRNILFILWKIFDLLQILSFLLHTVRTQENWSYFPHDPQATCQYNINHCNINQYTIVQYIQYNIAHYNQYNIVRYNQYKIAQYFQYTIVQYYQYNIAQYKWYNINQLFCVWPLRDLIPLLCNTYLTNCSHFTNINDSRQMMMPMGGLDWKILSIFWRPMTSRWLKPYFSFSKTILFKMDECRWRRRRWKTFWSWLTKMERSQKTIWSYRYLKNYQPN